MLGFAAVAGETDGRVRGCFGNQTGFDSEGRRSPNRHRHHFLSGEWKAYRFYAPSVSTLSMLWLPAMNLIVEEAPKAIGPAAFGDVGISVDHHILSDQLPLKIEWDEHTVQQKSSMPSKEYQLP